MRILILGSDTPLGKALIGFLEGLGRHESVPLSRSACRWKIERQAKKAVRRANCEIVVDLRVDAAADGSEPIHEIDLRRCHWVARFCQRNDIAYFYLSSSRVFSGELGRPYREVDPPDGPGLLAASLVEGETLVRENCERHIILRLGPVFSVDAPNLITQMLGQMKVGGTLVLDNNLRGCPVAAWDGARVISALLDQLSTGVEAWGTYHYGSAGTATYYEFAEALLASASQFSDLGNSVVQLEEPEQGMAPLIRNLDCSKIRNTFGVRQLPWRSPIADIVKEYFAKPAP